jgi:NADH dehydrogenase (ubiquinone) Fe-S protein 6
MLNLSRRTVLSQSIKKFSRSASTSTTTPITSAHTATPTPAGSTPSTPVIGTQAPNYATTWSANQRTRPTAGSGPRFEQTAMQLQPNPLSAMAMIAEEPIRVVEGRKAVCDGGMCT